MVAVFATLVLQNHETGLAALILGTTLAVTVFYLNITYLVALFLIHRNDLSELTTHWKFCLSVLFAISHLVLIYIFLRR